MSYEEGTFIEPLGCVVRSQRLASVRDDDVLLIIGSGISGILHVQLARLKGVSKIVVADINPYRLTLAKRFGASDIIDARHPISQKLQKVTEGTSASQVIVCTGATPALLEALECVDRGGTILFFAVPNPKVKIPVPITQFWRNEITIKTSYGAAPRDLQESLELLARKRINVTDLVTHKLPLTEIAKGFELVAKAGESLKVIITPNN
jgi:L-iditol 2-dehydrogenase